ncbi:Protein of unknown function precursor containing PKD domains and a C-terminal secretion signal [Flavobacterium psychrophilum]|uniref:PKD domain-containing protein n=1 Tax=Flavobacterium psychrophilum TaxID=96345 RepID=UPI000B7C31A7|nr:PKD domain-containing protein [Flavobacterium psychrophilum]SNB27422.1 Protein of unknown function precursor containing PKD domains and a C-terminal secretion signal [Flavobacterium psychrophilum]
MNNKNYLCILLFFLITFTTFAQNKVGCGVKLSQKEEVLFRQSLPKLENFKNKANKSPTALPYVIPVVFHILTDGAASFTKADMKCRIDDALQIANKDFNGLFPGFLTTDPRFNSVKSKMDIQFVMATVDPTGNLMETPGLDWHPEAHIIDGYNPAIYNYMWYGSNSKYYLDVVIVDEPNTGQGASGSGHAFLPVQNVVPHVTFNYRYIGSTCGSSSSVTFAKVFSHELGHYFGLRHTFQDDCDPINDGMADTPPTKVAEGCTRNVLNSCGVYANSENHMDYNVDCQNMFTLNQTSAMTFWLEDGTVANYPRKFLWQPSNLIATGVLASIPTANFTANTTAICPGKGIVFKDISLGLPVSRVWSFSGGSPSTSTAVSPTVTYATAGLYPVTLTVTNALGTNPKTVTNYIKVGQPTSGNYTESFTGIFPPNGWLITNPDAGLAWEKRSNVGNGDTACMIMNNSDNSVLNELDYIQLPYYNFTSGVNSQMFFDVAYTKFNDLSPDQLSVEVSTNCGLTWTNVYTKSLDALQTTVVPTALTNNWFPTAENNWRKEVINLSSYIGNPNVTIRFKNKSGYGTRIWIDNVNVAITQNSTPVSDFTSSVRKTNCSSISIPFLDTSTGNPTTWAWSFPGGSPSTSILKNPTINYNTPGTYLVSLTTTNAAGAGTTNNKSSFITIANPVGTNFTQDFEGSFLPSGWEITNSGSNLTWEKRADVGHNSSSSMVINNADNPTGDIDEIMLQPLKLTVGVTDFSFDLAYAKFDANSPDKLDVLASSDCGVTWVNIYSKNNLQLETYLSADPNNWVPTLDSHWRTERINLNSFIGSPNVLIKFVSTSGYGSRIWIDNVKLTFDSHEKPYSDFKVANSKLCIDLPITFSDTSIGLPTSWLWSFPGGSPSASTLQNPIVTYNTPGNYSATLVTTNTYGTGTTIEKSNIIKIKGRSTVPYTENFAGVFPIQDWETINIDNDAITWEKRSDVGKGDLSCLVINNADNPTNLTDEIILKPINFATTATPYLHFDLAYTQYFSATDPTPAPDQIDIFASSDCGTTWTNVYSKNQIQLQTVLPAIQDNPTTTTQNETNDWKPTVDSDWRHEIVNLSTVANQSSVLIKIKNTSGYGTRVWFDNIKINSNAVLNTEENSFDAVSIYPNPSKDIFNISLPFSNEEYSITIYNILGQLVLKDSFSGSNTNQNTINLSGKEKGIYYVKVESKSKKIIIKKIIKI